ncbi:MAG: hypothetical protein ACI4L1_01720 [Christensenellales bacterium]
MAKSLYEYASSEKNEAKKANSETQLNEETIKKQYEKYSKFSESELMKELFSEVNKQKKNGNFNFQELANKIDGIRPMLSDQQLKNLDSLLNQIK